MCNKTTREISLVSGGIGAKRTRTSQMKHTLHTTVRIRVNKNVLVFLCHSRNFPHFWECIAFHLSVHYSLLSWHKFGSTLAFIYVIMSKALALRTSRSRFGEPCSKESCVLELDCMRHTVNVLYSTGLLSQEPIRVVHWFVPLRFLLITNWDSLKAARSTNSTN